MRIENAEIYIADDNTKFFDKEECRIYEYIKYNILEIKKEFDTFLNNPDNYDRWVKNGNDFEDYKITCTFFEAQQEEFQIILVDSNDNEICENLSLSSSSLDTFQNELEEKYHKIMNIPIYYYGQ